MIFILFNRHEDRYGHINYFSQQQNDIKPWMRRMVTTWMLEVSSTLIWPYPDHILAIFDRYDLHKFDFILKILTVFWSFLTLSRQVVLFANPNNIWKS